jgi:hypothetical protein
MTAPEPFGHARAALRGAFGAPTDGVQRRSLTKRSGMGYEEGRRQAADRRPGEHHADRRARVIAALSAPSQPRASVARVVAQVMTAIQDPAGRKVVMIDARGRPTLN